MDTFLVALSRSMRYPMDGNLASLQLVVSVQRSVQINNGAGEIFGLEDFMPLYKKIDLMLNTYTSTPEP